jgi:uncharacterized repeat protein (TIGR01451 family)
MARCIETKPLAGCFNPFDEGLDAVNIIIHIIYEDGQAIGQTYTLSDSNETPIDPLVYLGGGEVTSGPCCCKTDFPPGPPIIQDGLVCFMDEVREVYISINSVTLEIILIKDKLTNDIYDESYLITDPSECGGPEFTVQKTANKETYTLEGELITYTVVVTNTGNVPFEGLVLTDPLDIVIVYDPFNLFGGSDEIQPGQSVSVTYTYTITAGDIGNPILNTVTATLDDLIASDNEDVQYEPPSELICSDIEATFLHAHGTPNDVAYMYDMIRNSTEGGENAPNPGFAMRLQHAPEVAHNIVNNSYATRIHHNGEFLLNFTNCDGQGTFLIPAGTTMRVYWTNFEQENLTSPDPLNPGGTDSHVGLDIFFYNENIFPSPSPPYKVSDLNWLAVVTTPREDIPTGDQFTDFVIPVDTTHILIASLTQYGDNGVGVRAAPEIDPWIYEIEFNGNTNDGTGFKFCCV